MMIENGLFVYYHGLNIVENINDIVIDVKLLLRSNFSGLDVERRPQILHTIEIYNNIFRKPNLFKSDFLVRLASLPWGFVYLRS